MKKTKDKDKTKPGGRLKSKPPLAAAGGDARQPPPVCAANLCASKTATVELGTFPVTPLHRTSDKKGVTWDKD